MRASALVAAPEWDCGALARRGKRRFVQEVASNAGAVGAEKLIQAQRQPE